MTRSLAIILMLLSVSPVFAQRFHEPIYDFSGVDRKTVDQQKLREQIRRNRERVDSLYQASKLDSLYQLSQHVERNPGDYEAITFLVDLMNLDYGRLRQELVNAGFDDVGATSVIPSIGLGFTNRKKRWVVEYNLNIFIGNKKTSAGRSVKVDGASLLNLYLGYDVLNTRRVALYPLVGINQQYTEIHLEREPTSALTFPGLFTVEDEFSNLLIRKNSWRAGPAIELDFRLGPLSNRAGFTVGVRYGLNYTLHDGPYKVNGNKIDYDPGIDIRSSYFSIIAKLF